MIVDRWQRIKRRICKMHNVQGTQNMVSNQSGNRVVATSIFPIMVDLVFKFWYEPLTLHRE